MNLKIIINYTTFELLKTYQYEITETDNLNRLFIRNHQQLRSIHRSDQFQ